LAFSVRATRFPMRVAGGVLARAASGAPTHVAGSAPRRIAGGAPARVAGSASASRPRPTALTIETRARAVAPGEPLRIVVRSSEPLAELAGTFGGDPIFFTPSAEGGPAESLARDWSAWAAVDLGAKPGKARIEVRGRAAGGSELTADKTLTIRSKKFPEQRLAVEEKFVTPPPEETERIERETKRLAAVFSGHREAPPPREPFGRPVPGEATGVFGTRRFFNGKPRTPHPGLDLKASTGTPVTCSGPGIVALADELWFTGNTVIVDHGGGLFTIYAHLSRIDRKEGETVHPGDVVGLSGATGRVTGPHLHWGAKIGNRPFDPTALLDPSLFH